MYSGPWNIFPLSSKYPLVVRVTMLNGQTCVLLPICDAYLTLGSPHQLCNHIVSYLVKSSMRLFCMRTRISLKQS